MEKEEGLSTKLVLKRGNESQRERETTHWRTHWDCVGSCNMLFIVVCSRASKTLAVISGIQSCQNEQMQCRKNHVSTAFLHLLLWAVAWLWVTVGTKSSPMEDSQAFPSPVLADLDDSHNQMVVHWAGEKSNVIVALARDRSGATGPKSSSVSPIRDR
ncbi:hypothetical protein JZ751_022915 [Albula glossodonta]|uniref:Uncharacterized protein n=1 Tax=Albula glossodonta TaxID=121402 RepID=A0A8T2PGN1_9TELE|nr:hypothetical protein JZ751_022915 [Albula glossodonta]